MSFDRQTRYPAAVLHLALIVLYFISEVTFDSLSDSSARSAW